MRILLIISWTTFFLGIVLKLLHIFGNAELLILGTILILLHSIIYLFKYAKTDLPSVFIYISFAFWAIYLLLRVQYLPVGQRLMGFPILFIIPFVVTLTCFILHFASRLKFKLPLFLLAVLFAFSIFIANTHSDRIYYFFGLNSVLNSESRNTDFRTWDKYSWFLYIADKKNEAIMANLKAEESLNKYLIAFPNDKDSILYSNRIKQHEQKIKEENWESYP